MEAMSRYTVEAQAKFLADHDEFDVAGETAEPMEHSSSMRSAEIGLTPSGGDFGFAKPLGERGRVR